MLDEFALSEEADIVKATEDDSLPNNFKMQPVYHKGTQAYLKIS